MAKEPDFATFLSENEKIYIFYSTQYKVDVNNYVRSDIKYAIINKILGGRLRETMA